MVRPHMSATAIDSWWPSTHLLLSLGRWLHSVECWGRPGSTGEPPLCLRWRRHCLGGRYSPGRLQGSGLELPSGRAALRCSLLLPRSVCWLPKVGTATQVPHDVTYARAGQQTACRGSAGSCSSEAERARRCAAGRCSLAVSCLCNLHQPVSAESEGPGAREACRYSLATSLLCTGRWPGLVWPETGLVLQGRRHLETAPSRLITGVRKSSYS